LKITQTDAGLAIVLNDEVRELLDAKDGAQVSIEVSEDGKVFLQGRDMSPEARRTRGRAFIQRYKNTFDALAR
jgi:bifunctional DNA-binding transcriptional regulator/antitoxin component of YhaV-PrlF toxin-antitoxin module